MGADYPRSVVTTPVPSEPSAWLPMTEPLASQPVPVDARPPAPDAEAAFTAMVEAYYSRLGAFALRLVGSRAAAEDVVHEVFLRIWRRRGEFAYHEPLGYLYQAVRNEAQSWRRHEARWRSRYAVAEVAETRPDPRADAAHLVELDELARVVEETVAALPPRRREIFRMQREQGLSYAQIASLLGISIKTVEVQIGHALKTLRRRLGPFLAIALTLLK
jgi:RNA polymerase sigma-70 factor (ECF subfamily)